MKNDKAVQNKSDEFAIKIVNLYKYLHNDKKEFVLARQILRSGTSIGANVAEAECSISKKEFLSKMYIAFKECIETRYWLILLHKTNFISDKDFENILYDCEELRKLLSSITKTLRGKLQKDESEIKNKE